MNRILLAYCRDNADFAQTVDQRLSRIGIPFEHVTNQPDAVPGVFAEQLRTSEEPVLLIVSDNFLKDRACMAGILPVFQALSRQQRIFAVVADGQVIGENRSVPTHIDRMVNALQYMNFWQNAWLNLSTQHQAAEGAARATLEIELDAVRAIANEMGDFISALRESGYVEQPQFEAQDYAVFFQKFGLQQWHDQYRRLAAYDLATPDETAAPAHLTPPVVGGLLTPVPVDIAVAPTPVVPDYAAAEPEPQPLPAIDELLHEMRQEPERFEDTFLSEPLAASPTYPEALGLDEETPVDATAEIEQTIADAYFWLERGHAQRGLDLLQAALDQHPDSERLQAAYAEAHEKYAPPEPIPPPEPPAPEAPEEMKEDARSYDLMGDMAADKGDFLFAKYCWDRAAELEPTYPGLFRKLGIVTSENLPEYRETAIHYLQRALEQDPHDGALYLQLARHSQYNGDTALATRHYSRAIELDPTLRAAEDDRLFLPAPPPPAAVTVQEETQPVPAAPEFIPVPVAPSREVLTVLVTGATSGIGRATAEIFARNGHRLLITGRRTERLSELKRHFENAYRSEVLMLPFDVRDQHTVEQVIENLPESWQNIDILVNNAGLAKGLAPIQEGLIDHWDTMIDTNIKGLLYVTRAVAPGMVRRRRGHIINVGSTAGKEVYPNGNVYSATKFAVDALTRSMRLDLHKHNIRVSQVSPGHVEDTEFAINRFDGDAERARIYEDFQPLRPEDVAEVIYFMVTRPAHVNVQDVLVMSTQQASAGVVDRSGR